MTRNQVLPGRHLFLLQMICKLFNGAADKETGVDRDEIVKELSANHAAREYWAFWADCDGTMHSSDLEMDIEYLHQRGYVFATANPHIFPTRRAELALEQEGILLTQ